MAGESDRTLRSDGKAQPIDTVLREIKQELEAVRKKLSNLDLKIADQNKLLEKMEEIIINNKLITETNNQIKAENIQLKKRIEALERDAEITASKEKRNQIEIIGIPEKPNENVKQMVIDLAGAAKVELNSTEIESCYRIKSRNNKEGPIVTKFKEIRKRDIIMKELKKIKPNLETIKMEPKQRQIFINEALTPKMKNILNNTKNTAKDKKLNRIWTFGGIVYIKIEREGPNIKIETDEELEILLK